MESSGFSAEVDGVCGVTGVGGVAAMAVMVVVKAGDGAVASGSDVGITVAEARIMRG